MQFVGRLHPLLVHLPIGILLLAVLFQWLAVKERYKNLEPAVGISLFLGMLSAILACITGFVLSTSGDYEGGTVDLHQWMGIAVAAVSSLLYYSYKKSPNAGFAKWLSLFLIVLVILAGHLGATLTHGEGFLTQGLSQSSESTSQRKPIPDIQAAQAYSDVIKPILQDKCYSCHGANKQKGKLRLDLPEYIMKGGKEGNDVVSGKPDESELLKRILLERNHDDHMPPKEKPQLTEKEIALLHWWVESGAHFDKQVKDLLQHEKIKPILFSLQGHNDLQRAKIPDVPIAEVNPASIEDIRKLKNRGVIILPVAQNSHYLLANFVTVDSLRAKDFELLLPVKNQLIWLRLSNQLLKEEDLKIISQLNSLTRLQLDHTGINDAGLQSLKKLNKLQYLNLVGTDVTLKGLSELKDNKQLQSLYLYQTKLSPADWASLRKMFPSVLIDSGGYQVQLLESDTIEVTEKNKYEKKD